MVDHPGWSNGGATAIAVVICVAAAALDAGAAVAQTVITGRVIEDAASTPVVGAAVDLLLGADMVVRRTVTDDLGGFRLSVPRAGRYRLRATRIGLGEELSASIDVFHGDTLRVILRMDIQAVRLPALEVVAHARTGRDVRLADFHDRADRGFGTFLTREDIQRRNPVELSHLVAEYRWDVEPISVPGEGSNPRTIGLLSRRYHCAPQVYTDGVRATHVSDRRSPEAAMEAGEALKLVHPEDVVGIEMYHGPASVPGEFGGSDAMCGVLVIWTG